MALTAELTQASKGSSKNCEKILMPDSSRRDVVLPLEPAGSETGASIPMLIPNRTLFASPGWFGMQPGKLEEPDRIPGAVLTDKIGDDFSDHRTELEAVPRTR